MTSALDEFLDRKPLTLDQFLDEGPPPTFPTEQPFIENVDGTRSNVMLSTFEFEGQHVVIPTMVGGKQLSSDAAVAIAREQGLVKYPTFGTQAEAQAWIDANHDKVAPPAPTERPVPTERLAPPELTEGAFLPKLTSARGPSAFDVEHIPLGARQANVEGLTIEQTPLVRGTPEEEAMILRALQEEQTTLEATLGVLTTSVPIFFGRLAASLERTVGTQQMRAREVEQLEQILETEKARKKEPTQGELIAEGTELSGLLGGRGPRGPRRRGMEPLRGVRSSVRDFHALDLGLDFILSVGRGFPTEAEEHERLRKEAVKRYGSEEAYFNAVRAQLILSRLALLDLEAEQTPLEQLSDWADLIPLKHPERRPKPVEGRTAKAQALDLVRNPVKLASHVIDSLPFMATTTAAVITGGVSLGGLVAYASESEGAYQAARDAGATIEASEDTALIVGTINALLEYAQITKILRFGSETAELAFRQNMTRLVKTKLLAGKVVGIAFTESFQEGFLACPAGEKCADFFTFRRFLK